jgi:tripartite-type tricarboxylate transporter receptor subunit TctC
VALTRSGVTHRILRLAVSALIVSLVGPCVMAVHAQTYPSRTVKIIAGQGPGTTSDILARLVAAKLTDLWNQPVIVEGHSGAAGTIAAGMVAKAPADGYMLLLASSSNLVLSTLAVDKLQYDPVEDFAPIGRIARIPWALCANPKLPAKNVAEVIAYAKSNPGRLTAGSTGPGSGAAYGIDALARKAGIAILNVPYRQVAAVTQAAVAGEVDLVMTDLALLEPHVKAGTLRLLAAVGVKRLRGFPDVPTLAEQGFAEIELDPWYGIVAPATTPPAVLSRLSAGLTKALRSSDIRDQVLAFGYDPIDETPAEFAAAIAADIARFSGAEHSADLKRGAGSERPAAPIPQPSVPSPAR